MKTFTNDEIRNFLAYERVKKKGRYNMCGFLIHKTIAKTGLSREEYMFVMENYSALKETVEAENKKLVPGTEQ